jgi:hypothetical protein
MKGVKKYSLRENGREASAQLPDCRLPHPLRRADHQHGRRKVMLDQ